MKGLYQFFFLIGYILSSHRVFNRGFDNFEIKKGDRIAQLILERCETPHIKEIGLLEETLRGSDGFGSTGK